MRLTEASSVGKLDIKNRIVLPPLVVWAAHEDGTVSDYNLNHYDTFQDVGLTVVEATVVSPEGRLSRRQIGAFSDEHVPGLRRLAGTIHNNGSLAAIQLHHAGGQTNLNNTFGLPLLAPSAVTRGKDLPEELTLEEIARIQSDFVAAAERVVAAGFDAIELHGAHGYLISQFLSPAMNKRQDQYGGSLENRARFALETLSKVKAAVGDRCLVYIRFGVADGVEDGLTLAEGRQVAQWLVEAGSQMLHVSSGVGGAPKGVVLEGSEWSATMHLAAEIKQVVDVPIIGVGGIRRPEQAEAALAAGMVDLVAVGKAMLADPLWASKALGRLDEALALCRDCPKCGHYKHPFTCPARGKGEE